jgi:Glycosyltransferase sugar-binding region containing DXD motif
MLEPLRAIADEIVVAADGRTHPDDIEVYREAANRVLRFDFEVPGASPGGEHRLAWLHEQCSGDWILRLDGDEQLSQELLVVLPELIENTKMKQYWLPRLWLDPSGRGWLDELPWTPAFHNRLVRNDDSLKFSGVLHTEAEPAYPACFRPEPFYHLLCALETQEERLEHSLFYEIHKPHHLAPGGGPMNATFYLPERFAKRRPKPLDAEPASVGSLPLRLLEPDLRMYEGEVRPLFVEVRNDTDLRWPGGMEEEPRIRLSYRWGHGADGERTPLPAPLSPGETAIAPVTVVAPAELGRHRLRLGLVHEDVRWLDTSLEVKIEIVPRNQTERNVPGRVSRLFGRRQIPRALHRIWLGPEPLPEEHRAFGDGWARHHPDWEHRLWGDDDLDELELSAATLALEPVDVADVARLRILELHGGLYVDTDVECLRPFDPLLKGIDFLAGYMLPGMVNTATLGATSHHPVFEKAAALVQQTVGRGSPHSASGPAFFTHLLWDFPDVTIFPPSYFYPYLWSEPERRHERFEDAYAVHHWAMSWHENPPTC